MGCEPTAVADESAGRSALNGGCPEWGNLGTPATKGYVMSAEPPVDIVDRYPRATVIEVADDFCDACGTARVRARVFVKLPSGRALGLCGHHGDQHRASLLEKGAVLVDHRTEDER
jgi:hypothetical protein